MDKKENTIKIVARIATENGAYIGVTRGEYGRFYCIWFSHNMVAVNIATAEQWFWATTWGRELEHGEWHVQVPMSEDGYKKYPPNLYFEEVTIPSEQGEDWIALSDAAAEGNKWEW